MSWEHFEVGLQALAYMERRELISGARASRLAQASQKEYTAGIEEQQMLAGLR